MRLWWGPPLAQLLDTRDALRVLQRTRGDAQGGVHPSLLRRHARRQSHAQAHPAWGVLTGRRDRLNAQGRQRAGQRSRCGCRPSAVSKLEMTHECRRRASLQRSRAENAQHLQASALAWFVDLSRRAAELRKTAAAREESMAHLVDS